MDEELLSIFKDFFSGLIEYTGGTFSFFTWLFTLVSVLVFIAIGLLIFFRIRYRVRVNSMQIQQVSDAVKLLEENYDNTFSESLEFYKSLTEDCVRLGIQIDYYTERKLNSSLVSNLVFKISKEISLKAEECILNFCASFVYDAGFLDVPQDLFSAEILSKDEIKVIKTHVLRAEAFCKFVPENIRLSFFNAYYLHHENVNGSGYPEGLNGEEIPLIARILRVVESFVSLTSKRSYHKIITKDNAVSELKMHPEIYDISIVDALSKVL